MYENKGFLAFDRIPGSCKTTPSSVGNHNANDSTCVGSDQSTGQSWLHGTMAGPAVGSLEFPKMTQKFRLNTLWSCVVPAIRETRPTAF